MLAYMPTNENQIKNTYKYYTPNLPARPTSQIHIGSTHIQPPALTPVIANIHNNEFQAMQQGKTCTTVLYGKRSHKPGRQAQNNESTKTKRKSSNIS